MSETTTTTRPGRVVRSAKTAASKPAPAPKATPAKSAKATEPKQCLCGCGRTTKGSFAPGHDARLVSLLRQEVVDRKLTLAQAIDRLAKAGATPALQAKLTRSVSLHEAKAAAKAAKVK